MKGAPFLLNVFRHDGIQRRVIPVLLFLTIAACSAAQRTEAPGSVLPQWKLSIFGGFGYSVSYAHTQLLVASRVTTFKGTPANLIRPLWEAGTILTRKRFWSSLSFKSVGLGNNLFLSNITDDAVKFQMSGWRTIAVINVSAGYALKYGNFTLVPNLGVDCIINTQLANQWEGTTGISPNELLTFTVNTTSTRNNALLLRPAVNTQWMFFRDRPYQFFLAHVLGFSWSPLQIFHTETRVHKNNEIQSFHTNNKGIYLSHQIVLGIPLR